IQVNNPTALELCEKLRDSGKGDSVYEYEKDGKVSLYAYISDYDWLVMIDSPKGEVYKNSRIINLYMAVFSVFVIVWTVIFNIMLSKQEKTEQKLEKSKKKQETIKSNLHTVALRDILTDVNNRIKFIDDFGRDKNGRYKIQDCPDNPYFFVMFNIAKFSSINIKYGHDAGDAVLVNTADILKNYFSVSDIYRTGSDEFVVAVQCQKENADNFIKKLNTVLSELNKPLKSGSDIINADYSVSAVKKSSAVSPAVLISLKDIINNNGITKDNVIFVDMD
ncbi:MAG: GGDEF domain-containing protein, partial [Ruminococcus sp.]